MDKKTLRRCIGCFQEKQREEMIKITRESKTGRVFINPNSKIFGRSAYLCYNKSCIEGSLKKNKLVKFLKSCLTEELTKQLRSFYREQNNDVM